MLWDTTHMRSEDSKQAGEAATQPTLRLPPLREGRHNKLFSSAVGLKYDAENNALTPGTVFLFLDGGRDGYWIMIYAFFCFSNGWNWLIVLFSPFIFICIFFTWLDLRTSDRTSIGRQACFVSRGFAEIPVPEAFVLVRKEHKGKKIQGSGIPD